MLLNITEVFAINMDFFGYLTCYTQSYVTDGIYIFKIRLKLQLNSFQDEVNLFYRLGEFVSA